MDFNLGMTATANPEELFDLIIIGGGPAGMTAGLYAARYKLKTLMIEKMPVTGGQLTATEWVENYPGFPEPILGNKLAQDMEAQAKLFGLEVINETVTKVDFTGKIKLVHTPYAIWKARSILISTGSSPRKLNVPGEDENKGQGVSYCATCDGPFYPDKTIAVVGGGNTAFEEALFLAKYAAKIYMIHRSNNYRADEILKERVMHNPKIELMPFFQVTKVDFDNLNGRRIALRKTVKDETVIPAQAGIQPVLSENESRLPSQILDPRLRGDDEVDLPVDGIFIFIGSDPNTALFDGILELEKGYIVTDRNHKTSVEGVWSAGDVEAKALRQVATAVGDGANAAYWINKYLDE